MTTGVDHALRHGFGRCQREPGAESLNKDSRFIVFFQYHILHLARFSGIKPLGLYADMSPLFMECVFIAVC